MNDYKVYILNSSRQPVAEIDIYSRLEMVRRFNDVSHLFIDLKYDDIDVSLLDWRGGWRILRNGAVWMEGIWLLMQDDSAKAENADLTLVGLDYMEFMNERLVVSDPAGPPYSTFTHDVRTGAAGDVIKNYVRFHMGASAKAERRVSGLTVAANLGEGGTVTGRGRFPTVLELCRELALRGGDIGFRFSGTEFVTYVPQDKTSSVIFSRDLGNLTNYRRRVERPRGNYITAGGSGEGTLRAFSELGDAVSITEFGRIEWFYDYRNAGAEAELYAAIVGKLEEMVEKVTIEIDVIDTEGIQYGRDYDLGDRVLVVLPGLSYDNIVREVKIIIDASGESVHPVIGTPGARALRLLNSQFTNQRNLAERLGQVERV